MTVALDALVLPAFDEMSGLSGEVAPWRNRYDLDQSIDLPGLSQPLVHNGSIGVVATGIGKVAAAITTTTILTTPKISLLDGSVYSVGVAGAPPTVPLGSVVIADTVLDWDDKVRYDSGDPPIETNPYTGSQGILRLDPEHTSWAREQARHVQLGQPDNADGEPRILGGVNVCGDELWHGEKLAAQVEWLTAQRVDGHYRVTEMEDVATATALDRFGRLDAYLSIRGVSNHDRADEAETTGGGVGSDSFQAGYDTAAENAVRVASELLTDADGDRPTQG